MTAISQPKSVFLCSFGQYFSMPRKPLDEWNLYGWTLKIADINKLESFELWLFRRIIKIPWTDRVANSENNMF